MAAKIVNKSENLSFLLNGASEDKMCRDLSCSELDSEQERSLHVLSSDAPFS
jgi:hypothetical protein